MTPRFHVGPVPGPGALIDLPPPATRHAQVLRLQPGDALCLFDGHGGQWRAELDAMGRKAARAHVLAHEPIERELPCAVTLALGMPANERMDTLVEKATELGVHAVQPLVCAHSVLRVAGERAERKAAHWQAVAAAACEQSGRNRVPVVAPVLSLAGWLSTLAASAGSADGAPSPLRLLLSLAPSALPLARLPGLAQARDTLVLSGPEGGLQASEEAAALQAGFVPVSLGPRVLRADTAPLAALAVLAAALQAGGHP
jgi:16S rRNA (uracil1498-N3)-methyltransferase